MTTGAEGGLLDVRTMFGSIPAAHEHGVNSRIAEWIKNHRVIGNYESTRICAVFLHLMAQRTTHTFA
jgi:hypothetical protein